jgi:hypothetical protein
MFQHTHQKMLGKSFVAVLQLFQIAREADSRVALPAIALKKRLHNGNARQMSLARHGR